MGANSEVEASIVYFPVDPAKVVVTGDNFEGINFSSINLTYASYVFNQPNPYTAPAFRLFLEGASLVWPSGGYGIDFAVLSPGDPAYDYSTVRLNFDDPINGTLNFAAFARNEPQSEWQGKTSYIGLRMDLGDTNYSYGWATLNYGLNEEDPVTINGFAFESTPNAQIKAGAVPEPSTVALAGVAALLLGGSAYMRSRRRREEEQKEAA